MAIASTHYALLEHLSKQKQLPVGGTLLEIGQANFYGDFDLNTSAINWPLAAKEHLKNSKDDFAIARCIYEALFAPTFIQSIDKHGPDALDLNLNYYHDVGKFDLVYNHGTAEHIFNVGNVFHIMHDSTELGGLMIHESPFTGWVEHGFYNFQPTLFWDLATANNYQVVLFAVEHIATKSAMIVRQREDIIDMSQKGTLQNNSMLYVALRKQDNNAFRFPEQAVYFQTTSLKVQDAWKTLR